MEYDFPVLLDSIGGFSFVESEDSNIRIYLLENLGTLPCADYWLQWKDKKGKVHSAGNSLYNLTANGKFSEEDGADCTYIDVIYTVNSEDKTYYLIPTWGIDHSDGYCAIYACTINEGGLLASTELFKTNTSTLSSIATKYNSYESLGAEIHFDSKTNTLYFPLVKKHICNGTYLLYQWDGKYFTYEGTGYWLHPSLLNHWQNVAEFDTKRFHIRIDEIENEKYRYTSWSKSKTTADKPDLIIENGIKENDGEDISYVFKTKEYKYVYYITNIGDGLDCLIVEKNGKAIIREKII
jgi:hypothetical protein